MHPSFELVQEITGKKVQYCRAVDKHQWDLLEQIVTTDFHFQMMENGEVGEVGGVKASWTSRAEWLAYFSAICENQQSQHLIGPGLLEQTGPDEIKAVFPMQYKVADKGNGPNFRVSGGAYYEETWRREEDGWRLAASTLDQVYMTVDK